jgi:hypothetical protein
MAKAERVGVAWFFKPFFGIGVNPFSAHLARNISEFPSH